MVEKSPDLGIRTIELEKRVEALERHIETLEWVSAQAIHKTADETG